MNKLQVVIAGDSHIYAIKDALTEGPGPDGLTIEALRVCSQKNGKTIGDITFDDLITRCCALPAGSLVVTMLRGNHHQKVGLVQHPRAFDLLMHSVDGGLLQKDSELIPIQVMREVFSSCLRNSYGKDLQRLKQASVVPVVCVSPPAPKEDASHIAKGAETYFKLLDILSVGVTKAPVRLKLWLLQQKVLQDFCGENGIYFLGNPLGTRDEGGYLKREYYAPDATHANAAYGNLVLTQVAELASSNPPLRP